jgi:hypothetical protein
VGTNNFHKMFTFVYLISRVVSMKWYASTTSKISATGTETDPWSLAFAVSSKSAIGAGDTLYLLPGVYAGSLTCKLGAGELGRPVTVRSLNMSSVATIDAGLSALSGVRGRKNKDKQRRASPASPSLRISCPYTVWRDLTVTNSDTRAFDTSLRKNSAFEIWFRDTG